MFMYIQIFRIIGPTPSVNGNSFIRITAVTVLQITMSDHLVYAIAALIHITKCAWYKNHLIGETPCLSMENLPITDHICILHIL